MSRKYTVASICPSRMWQRGNNNNSKKVLPVSECPISKREGDQVANADARHRLNSSGRLVPHAVHPKLDATRIRRFLMLGQRLQWFGGPFARVLVVLHSHPVSQRIHCHNSGK